MMQDLLAIFMTGFAGAAGALALVLAFVAVVFIVSFLAGVVLWVWMYSQWLAWMVTKAARKHFGKEG